MLLNEYPEHPETLYEEEDAFHASSQKWYEWDDQGERDPADPEGYEEEDAAYEEDLEEADQEDTEEVD
eukprot:9319920-Prorocentrum_lima.AAC.1